LLFLTPPKEQDLEKKGSTRKGALRPARPRPARALPDTPAGRRLRSKETLQKKRVHKNHIPGLAKMRMGLATTAPRLVLLPVRLLGLRASRRSPGRLQLSPQLPWVQGRRRGQTCCWETEPRYITLHARYVMWARRISRFCRGKTINTAHKAPWALSSESVSSLESVSCWERELYGRNAAHEANRSSRFT